jgi:hypothetical protein
MYKYICISMFWFFSSQCSRIPISRYPWQVNFGEGKVDFQTLVFHGQVHYTGI